MFFLHDLSCKYQDMGFFVHSEMLVKFNNYKIYMSYFLEDILKPDSINGRYLKNHLQRGKIIFDLNLWYPSSNRNLWAFETLYGRWAEKKADHAYFIVQLNVCLQMHCFHNFFIYKQIFLIFNMKLYSFYQIWFPSVAQFSLTSWHKFSVHNFLIYKSR